MSSLDKILKVNLDEIISDRYASYAKYIIQERALPDARDGLKPVQRRILFAMKELGLNYDKPFKKSARIVGEVIGKYHPHGDTSVYDALVRMSQDWKVNHPLIEMHGNKGSVDGDSPAAMRYTETRLSHISSLLLENLDYNTVPFILNFDDSEKEPTVLPALFPNLLINGGSGIASGYATNMPPHNLNEVIDALIYRVDYPECSLKKLMEYMKGPDFPTGGKIRGESGIRQAFETGKGRIVIESKWTWEQFNKKIIQMIITELPFEVNKADLVRKIDEIIHSKELTDLIEIRDETDRTGLRVVIDVKKDADQELIEKLLLKKTQLQISYSINNVAIINKKPIVSSLPKLLDSYINHQKEVLYKKSEFLLEKSLKRQETLKGIINAIENVDLTIKIIRNAKNRKEAEEGLIKNLGLNTNQAKDVVELRLYRLTSLDTHTFRKELKDLLLLIEDLNLLLTSDKSRRKRIKKQLRRVKLEFGQARKTPIQGEIQIIQIDEKELIKKENVVITVSQEGYIKRVNLRSVSQTKDETGYREGDVVINSINATTADTALLFTNFGNYIFMPIHKIKEYKWKEVGSHINEYMTIHPNEKVIFSMVVEDFDNSKDKIMIATKKGLIKLTEISQLKVTRDSKTYPFIKFKEENDEVVSVEIVGDNKICVLVTKLAQIIQYPLEEISIVGIRASGVKSISLDADDEVAGGTLIENNESTFMLFTSKGAKRIKSSLFAISKRAKKGIPCTRKLKSAPIKVIDVKSSKRNDLFIISGKNNNIYINNSDIPIMTLDSGVSSLKTKTGKILSAYKLFSNSVISTSTEENNDEEIINDYERSEQIKIKI